MEKSLPPPPGMKRSRKPPPLLPLPGRAPITTSRIQFSSEQLRRENERLQRLLARMESEQEESIRRIAELQAQNDQCSEKSENQEQLVVRIANSITDAFREIRPVKFTVAFIYAYAATKLNLMKAGHGAKYETATNAGTNSTGGLAVERGRGVTVVADLTMTRNSNPTFSAP
ncbi:hypothetical protein F5B17DRAFT_436605 [Nemania serpens]|nr:hypothetical protein F5B17DRAFT_436605 [Nemania serpens]